MIGGMQVGPKGPCTPFIMLPVCCCCCALSRLSSPPLRKTLGPNYRGGVVTGRHGSWSRKNDSKLKHEARWGLCDWHFALKLWSFPWTYFPQQDHISSSKSTQSSPQAGYQTSEVVEIFSLKSQHKLLAPSNLIDNIGFTTFCRNAKWKFIPKPLDEVKLLKLKKITENHHYSWNIKEKDPLSNFIFITK